MIRLNTRGRAAVTTGEHHRSDPRRTSRDSEMTHPVVTDRPRPFRLARRLLACALIAAPLLGLPGAPTVAPARAAEEEAVPPKVEAAVDKALLWLKQNQRDDGSWKQGHGSTTAVPSLAVMAYLARGHVPGQGAYGDTINSAIDFVLKTQKE